MMQLSDYKSKEGFGVLCLILPLIFKWLLPPGLETKLYCLIGPINIFIPNILLLFAPRYFERCQLYHTPLRAIFILWCIWEVLIVFISQSPNALTNIFCNFFLFGALYLGLFHQFSEKQVFLIRPFIAISTIIISFQLILLSTGIVAYDLGDVGSEFAGIIRVYTTAGESNGSGDLIAIGMFFVILTIRNIKIKILMSIISIIGIFFTVSRGPIAFVTLVFIYFWIKYFRKKMKYNFFFIFLLASLYIGGVFNPIIVRNSEKTKDGDLTAGRDILIEHVLKDVDRNNARTFGLGVGNVYQTTEVLYSKIKMPYPGAPHNSYVLLYAEQGIVGLSIFLLIIMIFFFKRYRYNKDVGVVLLVVLLTVFNTETVISVNSDYIYAIALLLLLMNMNRGYKLLYK